MSKVECFEYVSSYYPSMRWSAYRGKEGTRVLFAIYHKLVLKLGGR